MDDVRLIQGDCLTVMRGLDAASIDAIVTDPPYGQSNESYDRGVSPDVWQECYRLTRSDAALISFAGNPTYHRLASAIEAAGWHVRQMWAWVYRDGIISSAWPCEGFDRLAPAFDPICYATKGKVILNLEREGDDRWARCRPDGDRVRLSERSSTAGREGARGHWPRNLIAEDGISDFRYFVLSRVSPALRVEASGHPNQKPLDLMRWVIRKLPPGGTILDPYAGSGTTLEAALWEGFRAIGIESDPNYFAVAEERLARARLLLERPHAPLPRHNHAERPMPLFDGLDTGDAP